MKMKYPFEVDYEAIQANPDAYIDAVFSSLESEFLVLPMTCSPETGPFAM
jgi:hypothetical protein